MIAPDRVGGPAPGQDIGGRYRLVRRLAAGGMGTVWEAEHRELGRAFALKLLGDPRVTAVSAARFRREARAAAAIDHPNVVRVVDFQVDPVAGPYLVMELLRGETLAELLEPGVAMELREALAWLRSLAAALDAIHAGGLVHRDVKPENIVRAGDGVGTTVKLVDFGLAVHADGSDRITRQGTLVGTPQYLAPEAAEGRAITAAADVYSLAVVAYELLTGALPHDGETPSQLLTARLTTPPFSLAERTGRMFAVGLELAFQDGLAAEPDARPARATTFVERLAGCVRR